MDIVFTRSCDRRDVTVVTRQDGVWVGVPVFGKLDPIPHDLAHYVVERELDLQDGFWATVAAGGLFGGMAVLAGRQRPHAQERSRAVLAATRAGVVFAEVVVDAIMRAVKGEPLGKEPLAIESPVVPSRTRADRDALIERLLPAVEAMCLRWQAMPMGTTLLVVWPDRPLRLDQAVRGKASRRSAFRVASGRRR